MTINCKYCGGRHFLGRKRYYECSKVFGGIVELKRKEKLTKAKNALAEILSITETHFNSAKFVEITLLAKKGLNIKN